MDARWRVLNAARDQATKAAWAAKNRDKSNDIKRRWASVNADKVREARNRYQVEWNRTHVEESRSRCRAWYAANNEKARASARRRAAERLKNPLVKLHQKIGSGLNASLKGGKRRRPWKSLLGYSVERLKVHLERQFLAGMTWQNHGNGAGHWHIDHILPRSSFGPSELEIKACWALPNLRPLWAVDNLSKHTTRTHLL